MPVGSLRNGLLEDLPSWNQPPGMLLSELRIMCSQKRRKPQHPFHAVLGQILIGEVPIRAVPTAPLVVPARIVPQNVTARSPHQICVTQVQRQSSSPVIGTRRTSCTYPRFWPIDCPTCFGKIGWVGELP